MRTDRAGDDRWTMPARPPLRPVSSPPRRRRRSRLVVGLALAGLALAAAAAAWYATLGPRAPARLPVPSVLGLREPAAVRSLTRDGLRVRVHEPAGGRTAGIVVAQVPFPRTTVARGSTVTIRLARR